MTSADVPEKNPKGIYINTVIISTSEELRRHVDWGTHYATTHHCLRLAETQVGQLATVGLVQLIQEKKSANSSIFH